MIKVLICDDQEVVRKGLHIILTHADNITVCGLADTGAEAIRQVDSAKPDVILMDLKMPTMNGIEATRALSKSHPQIKIIVLTTYDGDDWVFNAVRAGASGYLLKDTDSDEIITAIYDVMDGKVRLDPQIAGKILTEFNRIDAGKSPTPKTTPVGNYEHLTARELSILRLMAQGMTNQQIADSLYLAEGTVKNNVSNIMGKLHANDRTMAVVTALKEGIVELE